LVLIGQREHLSDSDPPARILSIPLVVYIGKISYSLYLWHWPFFVIPLILGLPSALFWFFVPVSIISYHLIEKPFRQNGRIIIVLYGCVIVLIFGIVLGLGKVTGLRSFHYQMPRIAVEYDAQKFINDGGLVVNLRSKSWVLVLGNSMAYQHAKTINRAFSNFRIEYLTVGGTPTRFLLPGEDGTDRDPPIVWTHSERVSFDHLRKMRIESDPDFIIVSERWNFADVGEMQAVLSFLDYLSDHTNRLIILSETPNLEVPQGLNILSVEHRFHIRGNSETWAPVSPEFLRRSKGANLELSHFSEVREGVYFVPLDSHFLHGNYAWIADGQNLLYGNSSHLSLAGSMYLLDDFLGIMRSIVH